MGTPEITLYRILRLMWSSGALMILGIIVMVLCRNLIFGTFRVIHKPYHNGPYEHEEGFEQGRPHHDPGARFDPGQ